MEQDLVLKVSTKSNPAAVAGMMAEILKTKKYAELQAVGAGAVNQAVKSIAILRGYVAPSGYNIVCTPGFNEVKIEDQEKCAIKFIVKKEI